MATTENVSEQREETQAERSRRLDREKAALKSSPADDSLRARLLALFGLNMYAELEGEPYVQHDRVMSRYAAATTKAVAIALMGDEFVSSNGRANTEFTCEDASDVLLGLSALLEHGPRLVDDIRSADEAVRFSQDEEAES